jgi:hypothetical protein
MQLKDLVWSGGDELTRENETATRTVDDDDDIKVTKAGDG